MNACLMSYKILEDVYQSDPNQHGYVLGALLFLFSSSSKMGNLFSESITKQLFDGLYFESVVVCFNRLILIP